jgi:hypothetical protein
MHKGRGSWPLGDAWSQCSLRPSAGSTGSVDVGDMCNLDGGYVPYQYAHYFIASRSLMRPGGSGLAGSGSCLWLDEPGLQRKNVRLS